MDQDSGRTRHTARPTQHRGTAVPAWISAVVFAAFALCAGAAGAQDAVVSRLPTTDKVVALTFDACPTRAHNGFDQKILDALMGGPRRVGETGFHRDREPFDRSRQPHGTAG